MDTSIAIKGRNFAVIATDMKVARSVFVVKESQDKFVSIKDKVVMSATGDQGDAFRAMLSVSEKALFENIQNGIEPSPSVVAHIMQNRIHENSRKAPLNVSTMIAGKGSDGYELWAVDKYGAMSSVPFCANGYAMYLAYGIFDKEYSESLDIESALEIIQKCINLMRERLMISLESFMVKIVTDNGIITKTLHPQIKSN
ncbi:beta type-2 subunit of proteasome [Ordospora colligata]|uniref:Proteasome subunit beta n=1 Tax=Ordospora colligata OC4 TaxID=1354746 RepID=A0A0B2UIN4_9MICR|nr:beta type-2 subunit of proteasome [Ordospora colligata OC4]KHN69099.1 beta type-2 subunit of proteasome [Ordospora colligata OC4]TBU14554.1 beta type-2 subunit of proteasome [Ordospora colligata]TBU14748.1 beta type-2 subunit of proteasome [Ordospora colligata]TBU18182.1 beta type-2 subunit of proteasome [Ordospora colligata]